MEQKDLQLRNNVLQRVKSIHYMRTVVRPLLIKTCLFMTTLITTSFLVSIPDVMRNLLKMHGLSAYPRYLLMSFIQTQLSVQIVLLALVFLLGLLIIDIVKNLKHFRTLYTQA